jgi:hypothetical protein
MRWRLRLFVFLDAWAFILVLDGVDLAVAGTGPVILQVVGSAWRTVLARSVEILRSAQDMVAFVVA